MAELGALEVNSIVWAFLLTVTGCCACGAGSYSLLPAWFASILQVPAATKLTVAPEIVQTELVDASMLNVTASPEPPPVTVTVYIGPPTTAGLGGVDVNVIVCDFSSIAIDVDTKPPSRQRAKNAAAAPIGPRRGLANDPRIDESPVAPGTTNALLLRRRTFKRIPPTHGASGPWHNRITLGRARYCRFLGVPAVSERPRSAYLSAPSA
jgi:hypothetical protein